MLKNKWKGEGNLMPALVFREASPPFWEQKKASFSR